MARPINKPEWATDDITLSSGTANKVRPQSALRLNGYDVDEEPTAQELNWQLNNIYEWIDNLDVRITTETVTLSDVYPVGSIYVNADNPANPTTLLGFGTWASYGEGRVMVGVETGDDAAFTLGDVGGAATHTLTPAQMPAHNHRVRTRFSNDNHKDGNIPTGASSNSGGLNNTSAIGSAGSSQAHNNLQPYIVVHMWRRTA